MIQNAIHLLHSEIDLIRSVIYFALFILAGVIFLSVRRLNFNGVRVAILLFVGPLVVWWGWLVVVAWESQFGHDLTDYNVITQVAILFCWLMALSNIRRRPKGRQK